MSVHVMGGLTGAGKTHEVCRRWIRPALEQGIDVYTTIPVNADHDFWKPPPGVISKCLKEDEDERPPRVFQLEPKDVYGEYTNKKGGTSEGPIHEGWAEWCSKTAGCLVVLDEMWRIAPAGITAAKFGIEATRFFAEHRHRTGTSEKETEIVIITQHPFIDISPRVISLATTFWKAVSRRNIGLSKAYRVKMWASKPTKGMFERSAGADRTIERTLDTRVHGAYGSTAKPDEGSGMFGDEDSLVEKQRNILLAPKALPALALLVLLLIGLGIGIWMFIGSIGKDDESVVLDGSVSETVSGAFDGQEIRRTHETMEGHWIADHKGLVEIIRGTGSIELLSNEKSYSRIDGRRLRVCAEGDSSRCGEVAVAAVSGWVDMGTCWARIENRRDVWCEPISTFLGGGEDEEVADSGGGLMEW